MTEQERYKRVFSALHTSDGFQVNLNEEKKPSHAFRPRRFVTAACVAMAVMAGATAAYAADVGGIQRIVQVWFNGEMTSATLNVDESEGSYKLQDSSGSVIQEGGGVAYDENGNERPLTAEEIQESIEDTASAEIIDGRMYLMYRNQKLDITDKFDDSGYCYVTVRNGSNKLYCTVRKDGAMASSSDKYIMPDEFDAN